MTETTSSSLSLRVANMPTVSTLPVSLTFLFLTVCLSFFLSFFDRHLVFVFVFLIEKQKKKKKELEIVKVIDNNDYEYSYVTNVGEVFFFTTDNNAPKCRLISINFASFQPVCVLLQKKTKNKNP